MTRCDTARMLLSVYRRCDKEDTSPSAVNYCSLVLMVRIPGDVDRSGAKMWMSWRNGYWNVSGAGEDCFLLRLMNYEQRCEQQTLEGHLQTMVLLSAKS